jgi:4-coumarate--CoA ligase
MPFLAQEHISVPNKDLLSWMFDDQKHDQDISVSALMTGLFYRGC